MADLQTRLDELRRRLRGLQERAAAGEDVARDFSDIERQARELLSDAKNTPQEAAAQGVFAEVARLNNPTSPTAATVRGLARRARIRIEIAGDEDDIDEAIDILAEAMALNPTDETILELLEAAGARSEQAARRMSDLHKRYNVGRNGTQETSAAPAQTMPPTPPPAARTPTPAVRPELPILPDDEDSFPNDSAPIYVNRSTGPRYPSSAGYPPPEESLRPIAPRPNDIIPRADTPDDAEAVPPPATPPLAPPRTPATMPPTPKRTTSSMRRIPGQGGPVSEIDELLSELTAAYYAGEYQQTVEVANRILAQQPGNPTALEYREKSEDNLIRGVVPDHRIPFDARVSYNRANSLVRAGNYEEAERLYREARDLAERSGILSWKDAEQALLDIQDLALAKDLLNEGDRLMATDNWSDALRKYEGALRVVANDPQA
ncbi:MAG: tetratricopeptide repeat protein, partial [bacterium]|nr:tetratricopeptide repeat protein [bacterium]